MNKSKFKPRTKFYKIQGIESGRIKYACRGIYYESSGKIITNVIIIYNPKMDLISYFAHSENAPRFYNILNDPPYNLYQLSPKIKKHIKE